VLAAVSGLNRTGPGGLCLSLRYVSDVAGETVAQFRPIR
jgi:hypothetical protein